MKHSSSVLGILFALVMSGAPNGQQPTDQRPTYQHDSDFSPLTQITPANVKNLAPAWTFNYGAGSSNAGFVGLDYRFEVHVVVAAGGGTAIGGGLPTSDSLVAFKLGTSASQ